MWSRARGGWGKLLRSGREARARKWGGCLWGGCGWSRETSRPESFGLRGESVGCAVRVGARMVVEGDRGSPQEGSQWRGAWSV